MKEIVFVLLFLAMNFSCLKSTSHFVSSDASPSGVGSYVNPWQLQAALNHPSALHPGDTVWLKGGIYKNSFDPQTSFSCYTNGTENAPIIFRNYENERVTIDGQQSYTLYLALGKCSFTWFWGLEFTNSASIDRNTNTPGSITCTAENIKFINMIVHDMGSGIDSWKTAKNAEIYGCIIYNIGNNLENNGNLEGHGHGMYLQNDTFGMKKIHNNIVFSTFSNGIKVWQTTTTAAIGNFDFQRNIVSNGGAASENLGGVGNNSRTHNFFVVANGQNNPILNTVIKHNYTYSGSNTPRPPVNAFGLNFGVKNLILDSNYLTCQTRLGFNNTLVFDASVKGNKIIGGIPAVYGYYLWGFTPNDYPQNSFISDIPDSGLDYFIMRNHYDSNLANLVIYNWDNLSAVKINISSLGFKSGDHYEIVNVMDYFNDIIQGTYSAGEEISVPMTGRTFAKVIGSKKDPVSQFPKFGAFVIRKKQSSQSGIIEKQNNQHLKIFPNPATDFIEISVPENDHTLKDAVEDFRILNVFGQEVNKPLTPFNKGESGSSSQYPILNTQYSTRIDVSSLPPGLYFVRVGEKVNKFIKI